MELETIKAGIAAYAEERKMIERFLKDTKSQNDFDEEFGKYPTGRSRKQGLPGSGFILGSFMGGYGNISWWIDLLQHMEAAGDVTHTTIDGVQHYQTNAKSGGAPL